MKRINLIYECAYNDVDILCVPDYVADNIEYVEREFLHWINNKSLPHRFKKKDRAGNTTIMLETGEFIWWLNNLFITNGERASIIEMHGYYRPEYPSINL